MSSKFSESKNIKIIVILIIIIAAILFSVIVMIVTTPRYRIVRETVMAGENATIWLNYMPSIKINPFEGDSPDYKVIVTFNAENVLVPDGEIIDYNWNFDDDSNGEGETVSHEYPNEQHIYFVNLTVRDNNNIEYFYLSTVRIAHAM